MSRTEAASFGGDSQKQNPLSLSSLQLAQLCRTNKHSFVFVRIRKFKTSKKEKWWFSVQIYSLIYLH